MSKEYGTLCFEHWRDGKLIEKDCADIPIIDNGIDAILEVNFGRQDIPLSFYWPPEPLLIAES